MNSSKSFLKKYAGLSLEIRAAFWYTICNIFIKSISLITVPIFTRLLTEADYGTVSVYAGWYEIFTIIATLNLYYSAYNTANIKFKDTLDGFTSSMIGLIYTITISLVIIYLFGRKFFDAIIGLPPEIMVIIVCQLLTCPAYQFWMSRERFRYNYKRVVVATIFVSACAPLLSILFIFGFNTNLAFFKILGTALPTIVVGLILTILFFKKGRIFFNREFWLYGLRFNIPLIPHYLSGTVLNQSDRIMISRIVSLEKAGIYSVAYGAAFTIGVVTNAINQSLIPWMYKKMKLEEYEDIARRINQILLVFAMALLLFVLIIPEVIMILAPSSYMEAIGILPVLVMSVFFQLLYGFFGSVDFYFEKTIYPMLASVIAALTNLGLNYLCIPVFGYFAAGYTTFFSFIVMAITHYVFMRIVLKKNGISDSIFNIRKIIVICLIVIIVGFGELLLYKSVFIRYIIAFFAFIGFFFNRQKVMKIIRFG